MYKTELMEGLPVEIMAKYGNCQILPLKLQRGLQFRLNRHAHTLKGPVLSITGYKRERYANPRPNRTNFRLESVRTMPSVNVKVTNRQHRSHRFP